MPRMRRKNGRTQRPEDGDAPVLFPKEGQKSSPAQNCAGLPERGSAAAERQLKGVCSRIAQYSATPPTEAVSSLYSMFPE